MPTAFSFVVLNSQQHTFSDVTAIRELTDGRIFTCNAQGPIRLWSTEGTLLRLVAFEKDENRSTIVGGLELLNGHILLWTAWHTFYIWKIQEGIWQRTEELVGGGHVLKLHDNRILSWSNKTFDLWDGNLQRLQEMQGYSGTIRGVRELHNGRFLSWSQNNALHNRIQEKTLCLWDKDGKLLRVMDGHTDRIVNAMELYDGHLLSCSFDATMRMWTDQGDYVQTFYDNNIPGSVIRGALQLNRDLILSWNFTGQLQLWDMQGKISGYLEEHSVCINGVCQLSDGRLLSWSDDRTLHLYDEDRNLIRVLEGHFGEIHHALETPDGCLLSWGRETTDIHLWSRDGIHVDMFASDAQITRCVLLQDGRTVVVGDENGYITFLRLTS